MSEMPKSLVYVYPHFLSSTSAAVIETFSTEVTRFTPHPSLRVLKEIEQSSLSGIWKITNSEAGVTSYFYEDSVGLYFISGGDPEFRTSLLLPRDSIPGQEWISSEFIHTTVQLTQVGQAQVGDKLCQLYETKESGSLSGTTITGWASGIGVMYQYKYQLSDPEQVVFYGQYLVGTKH